jgi:hypothetical protein
MAISISAMKLRSLWLAGILSLLSASAFGQDALDAHAQLKLADNKNSFRIGEPIRVVVELTADREGFSADITPDKCETNTDEVSVTPESGVSHWRRDTFGGGYRDYFSIAKLSATPLRIQFELNDSIRFDRPGKYSVTFTTRRVRPDSSTPDYRPPISLTTNTVSFELRAMTEAEEEEEVKRLAGLIDAAHDWQTQTKYARELAFLTGDAAAREKVRRFFSAQGSSPGNYFSEIHSGIFIARNRALVLQLFEAALRDPNTPATSSLLGMVTSLRFLQQYPGATRTPASGVLRPQGDPRSTEIQDAYVTELASGLSKRTGKSQTTTAMTILMHLPKNDQARNALLQESRRILVQQFDNLHPFDQEYLMRVYWEQLRDPALVPSLKKMLAATGIASKNIHDSALKRLIEVSSDEARPFVIAELKDPTSLVDLDVLGSISDKTLPEADAALAEQIRRYAPIRVGFDRVHLRQKTFLAARFATEAIYADLMQVYRDNVATMPLDARAGLLAYFARINEGEAIPLIDKTLDEIDAGMVFNFLPDLTKLYYSDALDTLVRKQLESDIPQRASDAAYVMSLHGGEKDQAAIEARLDRWRKDWSTRATEADANLQGTIERELVSALVHAKSWKLPPERVKELEQSCVTKLCKQNFPR